MEVPKRQADDRAYDAIKNVLGAMSAGTASEIFSYLISPPLEKRREKWMQWVVDKLSELEVNQKIAIDSLLENEQFADVLIQATTNAIKTSQDLKLKALQNAVINTAIGTNVEKSKTQIFLNLVDVFTDWHLQVLVLINNPKKWYSERGKSIPNFMSGSLSSLVKDAFPALKSENELLDIIWQDLKSAGLHNSGSINTMMTGSGTLSERTTEFGKQFLAFIKDYEYNGQ